MNKIRRLIQGYERYIRVPWRDDVAAAQRVIFCVYDEADERRMRANVSEFELVTQKAEHQWALFDLTDSFAVWLASQKYAESYFRKPHLLSTLLPRYLDHICASFEDFLEEQTVGPDHVVAIQGVGSLFGFLKVKDLVDRLAPLVNGRLLIFFPGSYENNNYRLLDGYDGWNYLAVPITADRK
ncbi:MAG: DUF1788 domain-containing protein [Bacillota bacterium]|nr:DUF1788 domain-containing protein [Bacillota bacterium]